MVKNSINQISMITMILCFVHQVGWKVLKAYVGAGGFWRLYLVIFFGLLRVASLVSTNIWLTNWSDDPVYQNATEQRAQTNLRLGVYGALGVFQCEYSNTSLCVLFLC